MNIYSVDLSHEKNKTYYYAFDPMELVQVIVSVDTEDVKSYNIKNYTVTLSHKGAPVWSFNDLVFGKYNTLHITDPKKPTIGCNTYITNQQSNRDIYSEEVNFMNELLTKY